MISNLLNHEIIPFICQNFCHLICQFGFRTEMYEVNYLYSVPNLRGAFHRIMRKYLESYEKHPQHRILP